MEKYAIIGDVHSCFKELTMLLDEIQAYDDEQDRLVIFVGDLVDRGPYPVEVMTEVRNMVFAKKAKFVPGNHDNKFARYIRGISVRLSHGLDETTKKWRKYEREHRVFAESLGEWYMNHVLYHRNYLILDDGKLVIAHAGIKDYMIGQTSKKITAMCLYGDVTGKRDERGFPIRNDWASVRAEEFPIIVHGHTVVDEMTIKNNVYCVDTGCAYGNKLTALMYPEMTTLQVDALETYCEDN